MIHTKKTSTVNHLLALSGKSLHNRKERKDITVGAAITTKANINNAMKKLNGGLKRSMNFFSIQIKGLNFSVTRI